ncbi:MAG: TrkH family potassium uptake protein, partial [Clostridia bacterium]|nr:TrkH family potassium uptake protein [Clostridia bacterium]
FSSLCCVGLGALGIRFSRYKTTKIKAGESYLIAFIGWISVSIIGTVPYLLSGCGYSLSDSIFESVSGWTTTGAWVIPF